MSYDANNRLVSVTDEATGRVIGFAYNENGKIESITGPSTSAVPDGVWANYQYDENGNLIFVIYADDENGSTSSGIEYIYSDGNDLHNLTEKRNLAGELLSSWEYDNSDCVVANTTRGGKGATNISYGNGSVVVTDISGAQRTYEMEKRDGVQLITAISGLGACAGCSDTAEGYEYDSSHRLIRKTFINGRVDEYSNFDLLDRFQTEIKAVGTPEEQTFFYTYHPSVDKYLSITELSTLNGGNKTTLFDYDDDGNGIPNENPTNLLHRVIESGYTYSADGLVTPYEYITALAYDGMGHLIEIDGPLAGDQDKVTYTYDANTGDRLTENRPLLGTYYYTYDDAGNVESVTGPDGVVTTYAYDGSNRLVSVTRNGINISGMYNNAGKLDTIVDELGRTLDYDYTTSGYLESISDPAGNLVFYGYDDFGRYIEQSILSSDGSQTYFNAIDYGEPVVNDSLISGNPWKYIRKNADDTGDLETVYAYDASGNITSVTDANGKVTLYEYDLFNRVIEVRQPGNISTTYSYDLQGNLNGVNDAEGHLTIYTYDDMGLLVDTDSLDTGVTLYSYSNDGNLRYKTQNDNIIEYQYDVLGRLTHILYSDSAQNVTLTYDSGTGSNLLGRVASVLDPSGLVEYSYDLNGNVVMETRTINGTSFVTEYDYDNAGNLRTVVYPTGHTVEYTADSVDPALIGGVVLDPSGTNQTLASGITYKPFGPVDAMTLGNGISVSKTFDKSYQMRSLSSGTVLDRSYTADNVGNVMTITDNLDATRSQTFVYDDLYRLTNADGIYGSIAYNYDNVGNRLSRIRTGTSASEDTYYYYPDTNRLKTVVGDNAELVQYDADGNTTQRILGAENPQPVMNDPAEYIYNNAGQRIIKDATTDVIYHYDLSGHLIAETDNSGNMLKAYVWLGGQPLAMIYPDGSIYYFHNDHLGTPQKLTDSTGALVWSADYLPFGRADVNIATVENNLRFAGQYYDQETGLHYNYFRYYDPSIGRYLRADPIGLAGGVNLYAYVSNNPVNLVDPFGLIPPGWWEENKPNIPSAKEKHYSRNQYNQEVSYSEAKKDWTLLTPEKSVYHRMGPGNENNQKFVSPDGRSEMVFYPDGTIVIEPVNMGTYNYSSPDNWAGHFGDDVVPYWIWGNSPDDPTTLWERLTHSYEGENPCE